ncbi:FIST signal transduction protein [Tengunoibacter tsumagoiensis]|uniref:Histidine kinase n=1 Tax=Tengunoibacter tsumagoiensis TaxID=2014871 RepID=A0A401ZUC2_9CHLR|nr:FIST N-terminal domain-containing protein [Tengunoibacter tsumagoiensis]GCE10427.1 hypothetical protein KTT_02860 [Tengunoibacter tsumagoiensis]
MDHRTPFATGAIAIDEDWEQALQQVLDQLGTQSADLVFLFANYEYTPHFSQILRRVRETLGSPLLLGCSGQGVIGDDQELEDLPALSLLALTLPGATLKPVRLTQEMVEDLTTPNDWRTALACPPEEVNSWLLFADPFQMDCERLIERMGKAYPGKQMLGGLASGDSEDRRTYVFLNDEVYDEGGVALALGGTYSILPLVSQGCEPIGEAWTITKIQDNGLIATISNRPAYDLLIDTFESLSPTLQRRVQRNLLVGLAADEYQDTFTRGSFLIRQLLGVEKRTGALAIGALPRVGQTLQFQMRDAATADMDLRTLLTQARQELGQIQPLAGLLCTCNGRGMSMFSAPNHDAELVEDLLGPLPLAGLFCNGEIGPVGKRPFLHGFTASLALFVPVHASI